MQSLEIIAPGLHSTLQDSGRTGFQDVGVPPSGALDRISLRLANALVGNAGSAAALEMLVQGPTFKVHAESIRVAVVGCSAGLEIRSDNPRRIPSGRSARVMRGEVLRVGALGDSLCGYLAIEGGFDVVPVLGSASTYVRGGFGGFGGRPLRARDTVRLKTPQADERRERELPRPLDLALEQPIRVVLGPQADYFSEAAIKTFLTSDYSISPQADRMGFRLDGPILQHVKGYDIVSDGIVTGSIQVPGSGRPIVLMVDHQTTGGYPKIATVISADIPVVGRRKPGRVVRFVPVQVEEAERVLEDQEALMKSDVAAMHAMG